MKTQVTLLGLLTCTALALTLTGARIECKPKAEATEISLPRLAGLQNRYAWREAA